MDKVGLIGESEMYCPRCGARDDEPTKFCRQCGLPLQQIADYVATGAVGALAQSKSTQEAPKALETAEMLGLRQKKVLTILSVCIAPVLFAIVGEEVFKLGDIVGVPFLLVPLGVAWAVFRYKTQVRQLQERQLQEYYAHQRHQQQAPTPKLILQPPSDQPRSAQSDAPKTNPLAEPSPGSVVEDETRAFPER
jgi:hypothetical protein